MNRGITLSLLMVASAGCTPATRVPSRTLAAVAVPWHDTIAEYSHVAALPPVTPAVVLAGPTLPPPAQTPVEAPPEFAAGPACDDGVDDVYVLAADAALYSFNPATFALRRLRTIACPSPFNGAAGSMAVDRHGKVALRDIEGQLATTDLWGAPCEIATVPLDAFGGEHYGMSFATSEGQDVLFFATPQALRLGSVKGRTVTQLSRLPQRISDHTMELSSLPDGRLFGFFVGRHPGLAEIDPKTGSLGALVSLPFGRSKGRAAFAFAAKPERFFFFYAEDGNSRVYVRDTATGKLSTAVGDAGIRIVGAGVPSCVPRGQAPVPNQHGTLNAKPVGQPHDDVASDADGDEESP